MSQVRDEDKKDVDADGDVVVVAEELRGEAEKASQKALLMRDTNGCVAAEYSWSVPGWVVGLMSADEVEEYEGEDEDESAETVFPAKTADNVGLPPFPCGTTFSLLSLDSEKN